MLVLIVLLLDEVMAGLNHVEIDEVIDVIRKVRDEGISILVIERVIKAIKSLSDRLLVLHHGEKIADGGPDIQFNMVFARARMYRVWVQFQRNGVVNTAHFDIPVKPLE